jgi:hypothetical protein
MYMGINLARKAEVAGAISDGLITTAHPAAIAPTRGSSANTAKCVRKYQGAFRSFTCQTPFSHYCGSKY